MYCWVHPVPVNLHCSILLAALIHRIPVMCPSTGRRWWIWRKNVWPGTAENIWAMYSRCTIWSRISTLRRISRWVHIYPIIHWILMICYILWDYMSIVISFRISFPVDSSREHRSAVLLWRIRIFFFATSLPVLWIILHPRKFWSWSEMSIRNMEIPWSW